MSATILDTTIATGPRSEPPAPTIDLDPTTDLHDENTSDLVPATLDVEPDGADAEECRTPASSDAPRVRSQSNSLAPGSILSDRYLIEALIGVGGVSMVYRARDMTSSAGVAPNRQVALKIPRAELHDASRARMRLTHEYRHTQPLSHPNIVRVFDLNAEGEPCYMTMELIEGKLLSVLLHDMGRPLPAPLAHRILDGCARALSHAHAHSIVHGDFKPGNVLITRDQQTKVFDFGAASAPRSAESRIAAGTPAYASPEVLSGAAPEPRDDVFSFACVAYEVLTGRHPFDRRSSLQARDEGCLPPRAWSLTAAQWLMLLSALSWSREQRPADIATLAQALAPTARVEPAASEPPAVVEHRAMAPELADELMPPQRSWGFFVFIACALAVTFIATQRQGERAPQTAATTATAIASPAASLPAPPGLMGAPLMSDSTLGGSLSPVSLASSSETRPASTSVETPASAAPATTAPRPESRASAQSGAGPASEISFDPSDVVTSEGSVAVVLLIKRSPPLSSRARVQWQAASGSADAGIDFASSAAGAVEFAVGQAQRAIYVPLRNDLLKEEDETLTVRLKSPQGARLGEASTVTATIRDDD